jgi:hypothetical protein
MLLSLLLLMLLLVLLLVLLVEQPPRQQASARAPQQPQQQQRRMKRATRRVASRSHKWSASTSRISTFPRVTRRCGHTLPKQWRLPAARSTAPRWVGVLGVLGVLSCVCGRVDDTCLARLTKHDS